MLEVRLLHLKTKRLYDRVLAEQKVSERLLLNVLPQAIAERLKGRPEVLAEGFTEVIADSCAEVTVLFADIVEFPRRHALTMQVAGVNEFRAELLAGTSLPGERFGELEACNVTRGDENVTKSQARVRQLFHGLA